jgi:hypothetical protein
MENNMEKMNDEDILYYFGVLDWVVANPTIVSFKNAAEHLNRVHGLELTTAEELVKAYQETEFT